MHDTKLLSNNDMAEFTLRNEEDFIIIDFSGTLVICVNDGTAGSVFHRQPGNVPVTPSEPIEYWISEDDQVVTYDENTYVTDDTGKTYLKIIGGRPAKRKKK